MTTDRLESLVTFHPFTRLNKLLEGVQPGGGNTSHCDEPNDSRTMNTIGNSRNKPISPVVAYKPKRIRRLMALGVRSISAYLVLLAPTGDSG